MIDADPQHNLTTYLGKKPEKFSLLDFVKKSAEPDECIQPVANGLYLMPADDNLDSLQDYLANSGMASLLIKQRLKSINEYFDICLIDAPPQRSQIAIALIGAADYVLVPAEASAKGYGSLVRTLDLMKSMQELGATEAKLLGVLPFRDRWFGISQANESRTAISEFLRETPLVFPSVRESERYKQAISRYETLPNYPDLEYPFHVIIDRIINL